MRRSKGAVTGRVVVVVVVVAGKPSTSSNGVCCSCCCVSLFGVEMNGESEGV